jgi:hypothetical protein
MRLPVVIALLAGFAAASAFAKLPPPSDDAKAKVAEAAAKSAWDDKVGAYQLCAAMDRSAQFYRASAKEAGQEAPPAVATPPCADPGPYASAAPAVAKPLEASGAHSPPETATSPPGSNATAAEISGQRK